jgi:hypothetical protein
MTTTVWLHPYLLAAMLSDYGRKQAEMAVGIPQSKIN